MTHERRMELARQYRNNLVEERDGLAAKIGRIRSALKAVGGVPTLGKLTEFYNGIKAILG